MTTPETSSLKDPIFGSEATMLPREGYTLWMLSDGRQFASTGNFVATRDREIPSPNYPECRARIESAWKLGVRTPVVTIEPLMHPDDMTDEQSRAYASSLSAKLAAASALFIGEEAEQAMVAMPKAFAEFKVEFQTAKALAGDVVLNRIRVIVEERPSLEGGKVLAILHG